MSVHTKNKILVSIIFFLLVTNIFMLVSFINSKKTGDAVVPKTENRFSFSDRLKTEVGFDDSQMTKYEELKKAHKEKMKPLFEEMRNTKEAFYKLLESPEVSDSELNAASGRIAEKQKAIDLRLYQHFKNLREVCTPGQLAKFDTLTQTLIKRIISPRHGGPKSAESKTAK